MVKKGKDTPTTHSKKITTPKTQITPQKRVLMDSNKTPTAHALNRNAISHRVMSYRSCWGLGWGRCGAYSGPEQRQKATGRTGWGCCWLLAVLGQAGVGTPNCSGWGWTAGLGRTKFAAAVAAGKLWLVDYHCPERWELDIRLKKLWCVSWDFFTWSGISVLFHKNLSVSL